VQMTPVHTDAVLKSFVETVIPILRERLAPSKVLIFGSRARGEAGKDSDIDVIIVSEAFRGTRFVKRMSTVLKMVNFPRHVDFICYTSEEFERMKGSSIVVKAAVGEGIAV